MIELIIAMFIMIMIMTPLFVSFALGLKATRESQQDSTNNADAQLISAYFDLDVSSSDSVTTDAASITCGTGTAVLGLALSDGSTVAYRHLFDTEMSTELGATVHHLRRYRCVTGSPTEEITVARSVIPPTAPVTMITCVPACSGPTSKPRTVAIDIREYTTLIRENTSTPGANNFVTFGITASRKATAS